MNTAPGGSVKVFGSRELPPAQGKGSGLKGFEPLTYRCPSDTPNGRADLAKLQARGRAYWPSSVKRYVGQPLHDARPTTKHPGPRHCGWEEYAVDGSSSC